MLSLSNNNEMPVQVEISPAAHAKIEEQSTDELLDDLVQETVTRSEQEVKEQKPHYDDFEPEPEPEPDPVEFEARKSKKDPIIDLDEPSDVEKVMSDLSALPAETLVDTVDTFATEFIVARFHINEYEGPEANGIITSPKQKRDLTKATERYLASQKIKISPLAVLLITVVFIYGRKIMLASSIKKIMARNQVLESETLRKDGAMEVLQKERDAAHAEAVRQKAEAEREKKARKEAEEKLAKVTPEKPTVPRTPQRRKPVQKKNESK